MVNVWEFIGSYWWLVFPLGGALGGIAGGWAKAVRKWDERRREHKLELYRIKYGSQAPVPAELRKGKRNRSGSGKRGAASAPASLEAETHRLLTEHDAINQRWLDYELDLAKLIDFPVMSDMREPVTIEFHRAKRVADGLRPDEASGIAEQGRLVEYRNAVREFEVSFEVAEREAKRRRATDFSPSERQSLDRAKKLLSLAEDSSATHNERQQAYRRVQRELTGLIAVPDVADEALRHRIAGALDAPRP